MSNIREKGKVLSWRTRALTIAALVLIAFFAVFVRLPHCSGMKVGELPDNCTDKYGHPYVIEADGYFHVRIADEIAEKGSFGTYVEGKDEAWDVLRMYPEGRSAKYETGMIWIAVLIWRFLGLFGEPDLHAVEFWFSALSAVMTVLASFLFGYRAAKPSGREPVLAGLLAAVLVSCAPALVTRTLCGSFDTDLVQTPVAVLLFLLMTEMLRSESYLRCALFAFLTGALAAAFTKLWSVSLAFTAAAIIGGLIYVIGSFFDRVPEGSGRLRSFIGKPFVAGYLLTIAAAAAVVTLLQGPGYIASFFRTAVTVSNDAATANMPNMYGSVSELRDVTANDIIKGVGGIAILIMAAAGLLALFLRLKKRSASNRPGVYLSILSAWLAVFIVGLRMGVRFVEHLCAPVGILAALGTAAVAAYMSDRLRKGETRGNRILCTAVSAVICAAVILPSALDACDIYSSPRATITDASENAMDWVAANAGSADAAIASWWDLGYYYTYESGHPTLWDGGTQDPLRAIIVGKALSTDDMQLSGSLMRMLSGTGNAAPAFLMEKLGATEGTEALWETVTAESGEAVRVLSEKYGMSGADAAEADRLMHPEEDHETYLIVSGRMMGIIGWFEFYGNWDFEGENIRPASVRYDTTPDGSADMKTAEGEDREFFEKRAREAVWRMYFDEEGGPFSLAYDTSDGIEKVQVWKLD